MQACIHVWKERGFEGPVEGYELCKLQYLNLGLIIQMIVIGEVVKSVPIGYFYQYKLNHMSGGGG